MVSGPFLFISTPPPYTAVEARFWPQKIFRFFFIFIKIRLKKPFFPLPFSSEDVLKKLSNFQDNFLITICYARDRTIRTGLKLFFAVASRPYTGKCFEKSQPI